MQNPSTMPGQPQLGTPIPGTTGGLPALSGLSVTQNPLAQQLQSYGRGDDTMLVHMTPDEVNSLQGLAMASGGSLTINPHTGLPEAGWLGKLLPTILGFAGAAVGLPTWALALGGTAAGTAATGNLSQGLMMGLQAYGGASLAGGLGVGSAGEAASKLGTEAATKMAAEKAAVETARQGVTAAGTDMAAKVGAQKVLDEALKNQVTKMPGIVDKFGAAAKGNMTGLLGKAAPYAAGMGLMSAASGAMQPNIPTYKPEENKWDYKGPYVPAARQAQFQNPQQMRETGGAEASYFDKSNPVPGYRPSTMLTEEERSQYGFADGGLAALPATQNFEDVVRMFGGTSPGAITASMYPTMPSAPKVQAAPASSAEKKYNFNMGNPAPVVPTNNYGQSFDIRSIPGLENLPDFSGMNFNDVMKNYAASQYAAGAPNAGTSKPPEANFADIANNPSVIASNNMGYANVAGVGNIPIPDYNPNAGNVQDTVGAREPEYGYSAMDARDFGQIGAAGYTPPAPAFTFATTTPAAPTPVYEPPAPMSPMDNKDVADFGGYTAPSYTPPAPEPAPVVNQTPDLFPSMWGGAETTYVPQTPAYEQPTFDLGSYTMPSYTPPSFDQMYDYYGGIGDSGRVGSDNQYFEQFARGGAVDMRDGAFVVDARTVSELGNGSSNAGMELLSRMGGRPVRGPGDGVSDSVPASIGGKQEARVARDEVIFQPDAVRRLGGGSEKRGTQKLYALMEKAHKARKKAKRGQDTQVRKGLA